MKGDCNDTKVLKKVFYLHTSSYNNSNILILLVYIYTQKQPFPYKEFSVMKTAVISIKITNSIMNSKNAFYFINAMIISKQAKLLQINRILIKC